MPTRITLPCLQRTPLQIRHKMQKIIRNMIKCNLCGDVIESTSRHDFMTCKCGCCSVDGGTDYLRRGFTNSKDDFTDLSTYKDPEKNN